MNGFTRLDMLGAIRHYCFKNGLHITNLEKLRKSQLEEIIIKYDINVEEMLFEKEKELETAQNFTQNLKEKFTQTIQKGLEVFKGKIEILESLLNDEQKEKYLEFCDSQEYPNL
jgi:NADH dehydrogenase/NADH:ubiquinone oxidoreductase subunit G